MFQYIGEFCRYLLHIPSSPTDLGHRIRLACGNGLAADVWDQFKERFGIPRILEFYAATEGGVSLFNAEGKRGAIGRIPPYLTHRFAPALIRIDIDNNKALRDEAGFCIRSSQNEPGEAIGRLSSDPASIGDRFEGYTDDEAYNKKILRDVFEHGDMWVRTGDLMRKDEKGFFYFVDRIGDTFRWKGENVATSEVSGAICAFPGVKHAIVYGVGVPGADGRVGMAAIATDDDFDLQAFWIHLSLRLPAYARPMFLRFRDNIDVTGTLKYSRTELVREGYDPDATADPVYFGDQETQKFNRVDPDLYRRIQSGQIHV
jgi:fatty-acyl-CoA synthase